MSMLLIDQLGTDVQTPSGCEKHVPFEAALAFGTSVLQDRVEAGLALEELTSVVTRLHGAITGFAIPDAVAHFYRKNGLSAEVSERVFETIKRCMSLYAAWQTTESEGFLSLTDKLDLVGWHGFILQTADYARFAQQMGYFVNHATTEGGQGSASLLTMALYQHVFGELDQEVWQDGPGYIIYGWCGCVDD